MKPIKRGYAAVRRNWQVALLVVLILIATYFLFVPGATIGDDGSGLDGEEQMGLTNLQYGIDLAGGSRITAPVHGLTATEVTLESGDEASETARTVADALGIDEGDVRASAETDTVEVFDRTVSEAAFEDALIEAGHSPEEFSIRSGVTAETRDRIVDVLSSRIDAAGFAGGSVWTQTTGTGEHFIVVESPGRGIDELREVIGERGVVQVVMHYSTDDGYEEEVVLRGEHIASVEQVRQGQREGEWVVGVGLDTDYAPTYVDYMQQGGFDSPPVSCHYQEDVTEEEPNPQDRPGDGWGNCLLIVVDGEIQNAFGVRQDLAESYGDRSFELDPTFVFQLNDRSEAEQVRIFLDEGALEAEINMGDATTIMVSPVLAAGFLQNSLLAGLVAIIAVVLMVFLRYGDPRVAAPMSVTALSELYLLLGFAAAIGMSLDLAHMAGFIAVVGTGVDDLLIIADEVMGETDVKSRKVFDSRFRKAFWVIGAAAATTIIAMSPLAIMNLGDLQGFAIVTILGVLIGVTITRPAYGNILRMIKTDK